MSSGGSATSGHSAITVTSGKALRAGKRRARIDDGHVIAEQLRHRRQRLADVHRADDDELRRRHVHGEEQLACRRSRSMPLLPMRRLLVQHVVQRIGRDVGGLDQPLLAAVGIGDDDDRRGARRARRSAL